jgi:hypothetical protein
VVSNPGTETMILYRPMYVVLPGPTDTIVHFCHESRESLSELLGTPLLFQRKRQSQKEQRVKNLGASHVIPAQHRHRKRHGP